MIAGYGVFLTNPTTMKSQGFGLYSWNLVGLLLPPRGVFGFLAGIPRDGTHGQYEGESFIGLGALLLLVLCVAFTPRKVLASIRTLLGLRRDARGLRGLCGVESRLREQRAR